jgi:polygalacturonase
LPNVYLGEHLVQKYIPRRGFVKNSLVLGGVLSAVATTARPDVPAANRVESFARDIRRFGAKGDGTSNDAKAIQAAIDDCQRAGGGTVVIPAGRFMSGSLHLKTGVALHIDHGATLLGSPNKQDYDVYETLGFKNASDNETSYFHHALIWAEDQERLAITGSGTIDGNRKKRGGPKPIALKRCKHVIIRDVAIVDAPNYAISLLGTDYVHIDGVTILNALADGIDPDSCHNVRISNCHVESWDDAICPKASFTLGQRRSVENLVVTNCVLATNCNNFKFGTESGGDFKNVTVTNCAMFSRPNMRPAVSGISLLSVDGSNIDGVTISNIVMDGPRCPIFIRLGNRGRDMPTPVPGSLKNVVISNIVARNATEACTLAGIPGHPVESITLENLRVTYKGEGKLAQADAAVHEFEAKYPSGGMFGPLPAYGVFCRHAQDVHLSCVDLKTIATDLRYGIYCDDVSDLVLDSFEATQADGASPVIRFHQVRDAAIRGCMPKKGTRQFLRVSGADSANIRLAANDLSKVATPVVFDADAAQSAVTSPGGGR